MRPRTALAVVTIHVTTHLLTFWWELLPTPIGMAVIVGLMWGTGRALWQYGTTPRVGNADPIGPRRRAAARQALMSINYGLGPLPIELKPEDRNWVLEQARPNDLLDLY